jgi:NADPH:quinone reductase-like Zn-dependent oxidoreductase
MKMTTVKAARIHSYGSPQAVQVEDWDLPGRKDGQLLIRVHDAGVNPVDWKISEGYLRQVALLPLPFTLGGDFSGVVEEAAAGVGFKAGDEVFGSAFVLAGGSGSFAEACIAPAGAVAAKPRSVSHKEAAALPLVGVSALQALTEHLRLAANQRVLIHGGAGGIGSAAIQLAKHLGGWVATTVRADDIEYVKRLGADTVIDYRTQRFEETLGPVDAVLDTVGGDTYARSPKVLKKGGRLVSMLVQPDQKLMNELGVEASFLMTEITAQRLEKLAKLVDQRALKVRVGKTFPLEQASAALVHQQKESPKGKIVLDIF